MMGYIPPQIKPQPPAPIPVGDALPSDVRAGKSFSSADGTEVLGTLPERSTGPVTITPGPGAQSKPAGIYGGDINVPGVSVPAASVLTGTTIAGTAGTMPNRGSGVVVTPGASAQSLPYGYYSGPISVPAVPVPAASVLEGTVIAGTAGAMPNRSAQNAHQPALTTEVWQADRTFFRPPHGYYDGQSWVYALTPDLQPANVLVGKNILGMDGSLVPNEVQALSGVIGKDGTTNGANLDTWITNVPSNKITLISSSTGISLEARTGPYPDNYANCVLMLRDAGGYYQYIAGTSAIGENLANYSYSTHIIIDPVNRRYKEVYYTNIDQKIQGTGWRAFDSSLTTNSLQLVHRSLVRGTDSYKGRATCYFPETTWLIKF